MQITIELGNDYTPEALREHVIRQAAQNLITNYDGEIRYELEKKLGELVTATMRDKLDAEVGRLIREAIDGSIQPTDEFGQPKGPPTTLRGLIVANARAWFDEKVNDHGDRSQYGNRTRTAHLVQHHVDEAMRGALKKEIDAITEGVRKSLTDRVGSEVSKTVARALGMPTS
jgi:hypothetical protein